MCNKYLTQSLVKNGSFKMCLPVSSPQLCQTKMIESEEGIVNNSKWIFSAEN